MARRIVHCVSIAALALGVLAADAGSRASAQSARPTLANTLACLDRAAHQTDLLTVQMDRLCYATPSPSAPVDCYLAASRSLHLTDPQSILLCRCTDSIAPATCVGVLRDATLLTDPEMIALCSPTVLYLLRADCSPAP